MFDQVTLVLRVDAVEDTVGQEVVAGKTVTGLFDSFVFVHDVIPVAVATQIVVVAFDRTVESFVNTFDLLLGEPANVQVLLRLGFRDVNIPNSAGIPTVTEVGHTD